MTPREETDIAALDLLERCGPDTMGEITDENELAAALVFIDLKKRGLVVSSIDGVRHTYRITPKGSQFLRDNRGGFSAAEYYARHAGSDPIASGA